MLSRALKLRIVRRAYSVDSCFDAVAAPASVAASEEMGLYGFSVLRTAKGFTRFVDDAIQRPELVSHISKLPPSMEIISTMDEISNTVCSVIDSAELCRNTHPDREYVKEADKASMRICEYLQELNTNTTLYNAVFKSERDHVLHSEEARRAAHTLRVDFEKGGIHLPTEKLLRVSELNLEIALLGRKFNENIMMDPSMVDIYPYTRIKKDMQHHFRPVYRSTDGSNGRKEKGLRITTEPSSVSSVLKWIQDDEVRKEVYIRGNSVPHANLRVLDDLIRTRHELAQIMGCQSYAEFSIRHNMAGLSEVVSTFLHDMSHIVRPKADEEFERIRDFKRKMVGEKSVDLEPWDESYLTGIMKSSTFNLDSSVIARYFSLSHCLGGLKMIAESLFGATFHRIQISPLESWHPNVIKFSLHHPQEGDLGFLYLDLYSRKEKYPGCAHFAIRGGRKISDVEYQLPIVALVCNFPSSDGLATRLDHWDVETLFHEFGHALHSLLSRTDYQHFSGTRVALDVAETPSNLFEYYAWDYRVLKKFAREETSGDPIPENLVKSMNSARSMFAATELQCQRAHKLGTRGGHPLAHTINLINYGAGYYSYLYARCFAATIWQEICSVDPLSENTGNVLRTSFLCHGGAKDPAALLKGCIGEGNIIRNCNGGVIPDITSLCREIGL
ncbi:putative mitochondrial intermediate peptidase [Carex littledalei]|uniref:Putative mitochondrial intermediate peptidase n=1 Tax=Carex littledalei TaxID=544730 RepID=A0A833R915_9POAL|nr:putative mitochondrial intermediate peptidase [Carex littledalei]